jgi:alanine dehydrogenase
MIVGCVREIKAQEYRVGLTPANVIEYVSHGHQVLIEAGAGEGSAFADADYKQAGAAILEHAADVWHQSEMIVKVKEPLPDEYGVNPAGQVLFTPTCTWPLTANEPMS